MAKFKEIHNGEIYEFNSTYDIEQMRKHPEYEEVKEEPMLVETAKITSSKAKE